MVDKIQYRQTSMICECKSITKYNKGGKKEMGKTAVIFPGQGAQYVGMAKDFYDSFEDSKKVFDEADDVLDIEL